MERELVMRDSLFFTYLIIYWFVVYLLFSIFSYPPNVCFSFPVIFQCKNILAQIKCFYLNLTLSHICNLDLSSKGGSTGYTIM